MSDVPEADGLQQSQIVENLPEPEPPRLDAEIPEADALEQAQEIPIIDDDYGA